MAIRQIYDPERPSWGDWNNYIKQYIPRLPLENKQDIAPEYGYIFDKLRQKYGIFIAIIPRIDTDLDSNGKIVFRYLGKLVNIKSIEVYRELTVTGSSYSTIARELTKVAIDLIKTGEIIDPEKYLDLFPGEITLNSDENSSEKISIVSNTLWEVK